MGKIIECIVKNENFILDAGAGSGKTYKLMQTIKYLQNQFELSTDKKKSILCITYTNTAKDEIIKRLERNSYITVSTMHDFLWGYIGQFQVELRKQVRLLIEIKVKKLEDEIDAAQKLLDKPRINTVIEDKREIILKNLERLERYEGIDLSRIEIKYKNYSAIHRGVISHDELIEISSNFIRMPFFCGLFMDSFSHVFIDEYQDTKKEIMASMLEKFNEFKGKKYFVIGLFGDRMQHIYGKGLTGIDYDLYKLNYIQKLDNYRTCSEIIVANNILRADGLEQECINKDIKFDKLEFVYNLSGDKYLFNYQISDFERYTRLMLSHRQIAIEKGFSNISQIFAERFNQYANDKLLKLEDSFIKFVVENIISIIYDIEKHNYRSCILNLDYDNISLAGLKEKGSTLLKELSEKQLILEEIVEILQKYKLINITDYQEIIQSYEANDNEEFINKLVNIQIAEYINLYKQIKVGSDVQTLHGVKGDEFEKVIVNIEENQPWGTYNFDKIFKKSGSGRAVDNAHKLLYVACTRAKSALIINYIATTADDNSIDEVLINIKSLYGDKIDINLYR